MWPRRIPATVVTALVAVRRPAGCRSVISIDATELNWAYFDAFQDLSLSADICCG
jgi:hypothetical protein